jgi:type VI secretion system protein ImpF
MARNESEPLLVPSLLARLLNDGSENSNEQPRQYSFSVAQMKNSVANDLEELLNTRRESLSELGSEFVEVNKSILVYGLPDFTSYNLLDSGDCNRIKRSLETAIALFEPRLERVRVSMQPPKRGDRTLRFQIEAMLKIEPAREPVAFDTVLQLANQTYSVQGHG